MQRAIYLLEGNGPLEATGLRTPYDHPFFGQIFLAAALGLIGYPDSLQPSADSGVHSIEMLYLVPRVLMGLLAVADTFLIYKIAEMRYRNNRTVAFIAAILFAVMPITWILRRILLDNLLVPFLLSSILFSLYIRKPIQQIDRNNNVNNNSNNKNNIIVISLSGIFLGLAIFTKIPAFTFIPLVAFLVFVNSNRNWKILGLWFIPVILIPAIWPIYSIAVNQFDDWLYGIDFQSRKEGKPLALAMEFFFVNDPLLLLLGIAGLVFAAIKKDFFVLLWAIPFLIFLYIVSWVSYFHLAPIIPIICLAAALPLGELFIKIIRKKVIQLRLLEYAVIGSIVIFGFASSWMLITTNVTRGYFELYSSIVTYMTGHNDADNNRFLLTGRYWTEAFVWIPRYIFDKDIQFIKDRDRDNIFEELADKNKRLIFLLDRSDRESMKDDRDENLENLYDNTNPLVTVDDKAIKYDRSTYPYTNLNPNRDIGKVQVRTNF